jgi:hypothetical protein
VYGFGMSQTGRMLRHFLSLGLNLNEAGRQVFDGLLPHVGGARRGEFNQRFGQPSVQYTPGVGQLPPFDDRGLLARQRTVGGLPKIVQTNSSAEYWRGDCALLHTDTAGEHDLDPEPDTRIYHFAGTQHGPGGVPLTRDNPNDGSRGRYGFNCVNYTPLLRAALVNLDRWVSEGVVPPPSAHPRLADGTAVTRATALAAMPALPDLVRPDPTRLFAAYRLDPGPDAERGIVDVPVELGAPYPALVAALDADDNELGGLRLPDLSVPVGTHTGWNPRDPSTGAPEQITPMQGATFFFAPDAATRAANGDPRPSLAERYPSRDDYLERVRTAGRELAAQGYVLEEDMALIVEDNAARYDEAMRPSAPSSPPALARFRPAFQPPGNVGQAVATRFIDVVRRHAEAAQRPVDCEHQQRRETQDQHEPGEHCSSQRLLEQQDKERHQQRQLHQAGADGGAVAALLLGGLGERNARIAWLARLGVLVKRLTLQSLPDDHAAAEPLQQTGPNQRNDNQRQHQTQQHQ